MLTISYRKVLPPVLAAALLMAMAVSQRSRASARKDAEPFHERVRTAAEQIPIQIGQWIGEDQALPPAVVKLLHPNVLFNRVYRNRRTGQTATLLFVHCKNARDLVGHYPPVCYPGYGWDQVSFRRVTWSVDGLTIPGTEYVFSFDRLEQSNRIVDQNFMVLPNGQILPDMEGVREAAADYTRHFLGAAQIQLVTAAAMPDHLREAVFYEFIAAIRHAIDAVRFGGEL